MAALSELLNRVHDEIPAVPELMALRALSDSVSEFCRRTHYWQDSLPAVRTRPDRTEFSLYPDDGMIVVAVKEVRLPDGTRVDPVAGELKQLLVTPLRSSGSPLGFIQRNPSTIELMNATTDAMSLSIRAALAPIAGETGADILDDLVNEYSEALGAGAKLRLVRQASQPWYAPDAAPQYAGPFYAAINEAKRRAITTLGEASLQVQMRSW